MSRRRNKNAMDNRQVAVYVRKSRLCASAGVSVWVGQEDAGEVVSGDYFAAG